MEKIVILVLGITLSISGFTQTEGKVVFVNKQFNKSDTTRTFSILKTDQDKAIAKLLKYFGPAKTESAGMIKWENIKIDRIGSDLTVILKDGICETQKSFGSFKTFSDENDKKQKIEKMKKNQFRNIEIEILDKNGTNIINTKNKELIIIQILDKIIKE